MYKMRRGGGGLGRRIFGGGPYGFLGERSGDQSSPTVYKEGKYEKKID